MVNLIVRDSVLLGDQDGTGWVEGHGPVPGDLIRQWIADNHDAEVEVRLRRLYEQPTTGNLVAMDSAPSCSRAGSRSSSASETASAAPSGATHRSATPTTSNPDPAGDPPRPTTAKGSASCATTPRKQTAGPPGPSPALGTPVETTTPTGHTYSSTADPL